MRFCDVVYQNLKKYPLMQACDAVKLAYQSEFGAGHMISDIEKAKRHFYAELECTPTNPLTPLIEELSENLVRVNFAAVLENGINPERLFEAFLKSARIKRGTRSGFDKKIEILLSLDTPFSKEEILECVEKMGGGETPAPTSHSEEYRGAYEPHYRVVDLDVLKKETEI